MSLSCSLARARSCAFWLVVQDGQHVVGDPRQERRVVPALLGVDVPHVLEAEVVGDLAGRQEGVAGRSRPSGRPGRRRRSCGAAPGPRWLVQWSIAFLGPVLAGDDPSALAWCADQDRLPRCEGEAACRRLLFLAALAARFFIALSNLGRWSIHIDNLAGCLILDRCGVDFGFSRMGPSFDRDSIFERNNACQLFAATAGNRTSVPSSSRRPSVSPSRPL